MQGSKITLFDSSLIKPPKEIAMTLLTSDPSAFIEKLMENNEWFSYETALKLDKYDPLNESRKKFNTHDIHLLNAHVDNYIFLPGWLDKREMEDIQLNLHQEDYQKSREKIMEKHAQRQTLACAAVRELIGYADEDEFIFTSRTLAGNLQLMIELFKPDYKDWIDGKYKIVMLDNDLYKKNKKVIKQALQRIIQTAAKYGCFSESLPDINDIICLIKPNQNKHYCEKEIAEFVSRHKTSINMLLLPSVIVETGQRLQMPVILNGLAEEISNQEIIIGLDLSETLANRMIDLKTLPGVAFAVSNAKYLCVSETGSLGLYVNKKYNQNGAVDFADDELHHLIPAKSWLEYFHQQGWRKYMSKSECLSLYIINLLKKHFGNQITIITPEDTLCHGSAIVFRFTDLKDADFIGEFLMSQKTYLGSFKIEVVDSDIYINPHYAYASFSKINKAIEKIIHARKILNLKVANLSMLELDKTFTFDWTNSQNIAVITDIAVQIDRQIKDLGIDKTSYEEVMAYIALNFKLATYYNHVMQNPEKALEKLDICETHYLQKTSVSADLASVRIQMAYASQQLAVYASGNYAEDENGAVINNEQMCEYAARVNKYLQLVVKMYQHANVDDKKWQQIMADLNHILALELARAHKYDDNISRDEVLQQYQVTIIRYEKAGISHDQFAKLLLDYASFLLLNEQYRLLEECQLCLKKYWEKNDVEHNPYKQRFENANNEFTRAIISNKKKLKEQEEEKSESDKLTKEGSKNRLSPRKFISNPFITITEHSSSPRKPSL